MASLGNLAGGGKFSYSQFKSSGRISNLKNSFFLSVPNHSGRKRSLGRNSASLMALANSNSNSPVKHLPETKIDEWMEGSVTDIVQNLKEAPLLVHVYTEADGRGNSSKSEFKTEKAIRENWPTVKSKWRNGEDRSPEGLIFVEELNDEDGGKIEEGVTRAWGIVVQGKGVECGPACYLLKTSRVEAGCGYLQLQNCWLLE